MTERVSAAVIAAHPGNASELPDDRTKNSLTHFGRV